MKSLTAIIGVILIIVGVAYYAFQGFRYTSQEQLVDIGPVQATRQTERSIPYSPLVAGSLVGGGVILLIIGSVAITRRNTHS